VIKTADSERRGEVRRGKADGRAEKKEEGREREGADG
jgi:hypothetical protein